MRYAIISDLHANRQAVKSVLADIVNSGADEIICLGDIVGYGPSPREVLDLAFGGVDHFILGNHDAVVAGKMSAGNFNDNARFFIDWTCKKLEGSGAAKRFTGFPLVLKASGIRLTHGEFEEPGRFGYIIEDDEAARTFACCEEQLLFSGHSHVPGIFVIGNSGVPHWLPPQNFGVEEDKRYIVNVGSVGQPRDNSVFASYCLLDLDKMDVLFRQIPFDVVQFRDDLTKFSLPLTAHFLNLGKDIPPARPRQLIEFTPLDAKISVESDVKTLEKTVVELKKSKTRLLLLLSLALVALAAVSAIVFLRPVEIVTETANMFTIEAWRTELPVELRSLTLERELLSMPDRAHPAEKDSPFDMWSVSLSAPEFQSVSSLVEDGGDTTELCFKVVSGEMKPMEITSVVVSAKKGQRFTAAAQFKNITLYAGFTEIVLQQQIEDGSWRDLLKREPSKLSHRTSWIQTSVTQSSSSPLDSDAKIRLVVRANLQGEILIRKCSLTRK